MRFMSIDPRKSIPVPVGYHRSVLQRLGDSPERREALVRGTGLCAEGPREGEIFTLESSLALVENLCREIGEEWPLRVLPTWSSPMQGALEVAARSAPDVGESLEIITRFAHVRAPCLVLRSKKTEFHRGVVLSPGVAMSPVAWRSRLMVAMLSIGSILAEIFQGDTRGLRFDIAWPTPDYAEKLRSALPGEVTFSSRASAIIVPAELCTRRSPFADHDLLACSVAELETAAKRVAGVDLLPLRLELLLYSHNERLPVAQAARLLGMARRTLARRLAEHGVSYRSILETVLKQRADELANSNMISRAELANALGYSEPTSLSRARRRWSKPPVT